MGEEEDEEEEVCKVVLLGESGVGKTCIISRFINNTFEEGLMSTNGASYASKISTFPEYENRTIKFEIWDTAGQEKYRALNQIFYKDASICILVYDVTSMISFKALQDYWCQQVKEQAPKNVVFGLAGNKCDLIEKEEVSEEMARNLAKEMNAIFETTSAAKNIGVEQLFHNVGCKYIDPNYKTNEDSTSDVKQRKLSEKKIKKNIKLDDKNNKDVNKKKKCC
jgi:small GTP-binding protein